MADLFEKTWINSLELSNRAVRSATWSGVADDRGYVTDVAVEFYRRLGAGGIGLIVTGYQHVMPNGIQSPYMIGNFEAQQTQGLSRLAAAAHEGGGRIIPQLVHAGGRANRVLLRKGDEVWAPSAISDPDTGLAPKEVTRQDILTLVEAYAAAASRSKQAGFDGVQLHGAHGYGINQFLSPAWNKRGDAYGGSAKNRYRFLGEVLEAVRATVGDDFPVLIKLAGHDYVEGGLSAEDSLQIARRLADDGIDAIEISGGSSASPKKLGPARTKIRTAEDEAYFLELAALVKEAIPRVSVITVGGIRSLTTIRDLLSEGKADYIAMSRPFIREPDLMHRWMAGDTERSKCVSCNLCFAAALEGNGVYCKAEKNSLRRLSK
jgi:2,4-dienoyl-CoA reductase-like NADH-dependent reductase (Old Yellow Enzyme family)